MLTSGDGTTGLRDLALRRCNFTVGGVESPNAVPEPASLTLTFFALAALTLNLRRKVR